MREILHKKINFKLVLFLICLRIIVKPGIVSDILYVQKIKNYNKWLIENFYSWNLIPVPQIINFDDIFFDTWAVFSVSLNF